MTIARWVKLSVFAVIISSAASLLQAAPASALYSGGNLIDDLALLDSKSMSAQDIQNFLTNMRSGLANYRLNFDCSITDAAESYYRNAGAPCGQVVPASQVIYYTSQVYGINPKAILATLQKEQSLVTATNPTSTQINYAMGYACPTTTGCTIGGFIYQVDNGVWTLRLNFERARGNMNWWFRATSWVCGTTKNFYKPNLYPRQNVNFYDESGVYYRTHYISNAATSSFYCYTPHAYNNPLGLYGLPVYGTTGKYYSGSYNFVRFYEAWFGSTHSSPFFQLPGSVSTYIMGANNTYYTIYDYERLKDYGFETRFGLKVNVVDQAFINTLTHKGALPAIARFEGLGIFVPQLGTLHAFTDEQIFYDYGYQFGQEAVLPAWVQDSLTVGEPMQRVVKPADSSAFYYVDNGNKGVFCNGDSFTKLGTPAYSTQPSVALRSYYLNTLPDGKPIARNGDLIMSSDGSLYGVYNDESLAPVSSSVAQNSGAINCMAPRAAISQLTQGTNIGSLVRDSAGNAYILDYRTKIAVSDHLEAIGKTINDFSLVDDSLLSRIPASDFSPLMKVRNTIGVHLIKDGKNYAIPSQDDLFGLNYARTNILDVTADTFGSINSGNVIFKPGRVVRVDGGIGVYLLEDSFKMYVFPNESVFLGYGFKWSDVINVSSYHVKDYTLLGPVPYFVQTYDSNIWLMAGGKKYYANPAMLSASNYNVDSTRFIPVSSNTYDPNARGADLTQVFRADNGRGVYMIENGKKRVFSSEAALFAKGFSWSDVLSLPSSYVSSIPDGLPIY